MGADFLVYGTYHRYHVELTQKRCQRIDLSEGKRKIAGLDQNRASFQALYFTNECSKRTLA
jgi:hypothetical protein